MFVNERGSPLTVIASLLLVALQAGEGSATPRSQTQIAFTSMGAVGSVFTVNPDGTGLRKVVSNASNALWSPDRTRLVFTRRVPIGEDFRGDTVYRSDLHTIRADGSELRLLIRAAAYPTWSADGQSLAVLRGDFDLWTVGVDGTGARRIVKKSVEEPTWSPDGRWIAFTWYAKDLNEVWLVHPDGTGLRRLVKRKAVENDSPAWAPDGRRVSVMGGFDSDKLYVVGVDGGSLQQVTRANAINEWSPTGREIMFLRGYLEREPNALWVTRLDGRREARLAQRVSSPDWSPNGRDIAFIRRLKVYVMNADGKAVRVVTAGGPAAGGLDW